MEFDKDFQPRPYEVKALQHVNQISLEDRVALGIYHDKLDEHNRYCGYTRGYQQAVTDAMSFLKNNGMINMAFRIQQALLYGIVN